MADYKGIKIGTYLDTSSTYPIPLVNKEDVYKKVDKVDSYRKEASRLASLANKRIKRLENAGLTDSPAYQKYINSGGVKFGVRGKTHNQLQQEVSRINQFINSQTSTIRGVNTQLKDLAKNTGIKYSNLKELRSKASKFFELASKVEQYLRTVDDMASAIGYQKIWTAINQYVETEKVDLGQAKNDIDRMILEVTKAMGAFEDKIPLEDVMGNAGWYKLPKD